MKYCLEDSACTIWIDKLCCVKYSVNNDIVIGKKIVLYTAARKNIQKELADVEVGYYPDMPGGGEVISCIYFNVLYGLKVFVNRVNVLGLILE